ncbi:hypothetical protein GGI11_005839, partial [Coemansia sp. RSA 2049]
MKDACGVVGIRGAGPPEAIGRLTFLCADDGAVGNAGVEWCFCIIGWGWYRPPAAMLRGGTTGDGVTAPLMLLMFVVKTGDDWTLLLT